MIPKCWYVLVRPDNGYPVLIYPEKERAKLVASKNGYKVVPVSPVDQMGATPFAATAIDRGVVSGGATP